MSPDVSNALMRGRLMEILYRHGVPMTTAQLREHGAEVWPALEMAVTDQVYRGLRLLRQHGLVRRVYVKPGPNTHWLLMRAGAASAAAPRAALALAQAQPTDGSGR